MMDKPTILIIGAGFTGCALAYDLTLRGFSVTVVDRGEICSGTSGRTHGLLHSGSRYCVNDPEAAVECIEENTILRRIARQCIEFNNGLFLAISEEELAYKETFKAGAEKCGIPIRWMDKKDILSREPAINPQVLGGFEVPDGSFDPLRLALAFAGSARNRGAIFLPFHQVESIHIDGRSSVDFIILTDRHTGRSIEQHADMVINATGAWAGKIAEMAGVNVPVIPSPGVMVAFEKRMSNYVVNRLSLPGDGDIIIPQRRMSVIGTTSFEVNDADYIPVDQGMVKEMVDRAIEMIPAIARVKIRASYMSARPLIQTGTNARSLSRTFKVFDHETDHGLKGFITITGGKATTCRVMAEKTADLVCEKFAWRKTCQTKDFELDSYRTFYNRQA
ncbi:FAD-dependent oxidoreductase [Leptolinea tardivitalis]|nr:FAD-dependent oxidoreductase [Leptolinea tardivitalis]GAP21017.1 glycerol-3-phosphate dehydrogenase [Leptolinea tardivitalis]